MRKDNFLLLAKCHSASLQGATRNRRRMKKFEFILTVQVGVENIGLPSFNPLFQLRDKRKGRGGDGGGNAEEGRERE